MPYCTKSDIVNLEVPEEKLAQLTGDGEGAVNDDVVAAAIEAADSEIDTYLAGRYTVPLSVVPAAVKRASVCIAVYIMHRRLRRKDDTVWDGYMKALAFLKAVRDGDDSLSGVTSGNGAVSTTDGLAQDFTRTKRDSGGNVVGDDGSTEVW